MSFTNDWAAKYNKAILTFTGRNKVAVRELEEVVKKTGPVVEALKKCDEPGDIDKLVSEAKSKAAAEIAKAHKKYFAKAASNYGKVLDTAINATDKVVHPDTYRELKALKAYLEWLDAAIENKAHSALKSSLKADVKAKEKIDKEREKLRKTGDKSDVEVEKEVDFLKQAKLLLAFPTAVKAAAGRAVLAIQTIKKDPTPATYKDQMEKGGRNFTQQMSNLVKLTKDPKCPDKIKSLLNGLDAFKAELDAFGNGPKRTIADSATKTDILNRVKEYSTLYKATKPYAIKMVGYMKKNKLKAKKVK